MIRYALLTLIVSALCIYSLKDWYKALCFSLPIIAVLERPDMPRMMLGIPGLNPFNILLLFMILGWFLQKNKEGLKWTAPARMNILLVLYLLVVTISCTRMILDAEGFVEHRKLFYLPALTVGQLVRDDFFNAWKWLIPGLLLCHGVNSKERADLAMQFVLITGLLLGVQIILRMWPALLGLDDLQRRGMRVFDRDIGYHRGELGPFMASCAWGCIVYATSAVPKIKARLGYVAFLGATLALMATGSRGAAVAWAACAVVFGLLKWRKILLFGPLVVILGLMLVPGAKERYLFGFSGDEHHLAISERSNTITEEGYDAYNITSGRILVWPRVLETAMETPFLGRGMRAYERAGVFDKLYLEGILTYGSGFFHHPHNAYLMIFLDMGILGLIIILAFYINLLLSAARAFYKGDRGSTERSMAGFLLAFTVVALVAGIFSGTLYPDQGSVLQWCTIGLFMGTVGQKYGDVEDPVKSVGEIY